MQQLTGVDELFVGLESPTTNAVVGILIRFDDPQGDQRLPDEPFMRHRLHERLDQLPPMRQVLVQTPLQLDYAYLAEVGRVDVAAHLTTVHLPQPGTEGQLAEEVARVMGTSLVPNRPRWDYTIIDGLEGGGIAHLLRVDHAAVDGAMFTYIFDVLSDAPPPPNKADAMKPFPEPVGGSVEILARTAFTLATRPAQLARLQVGLARWLVDRYPADGPTTVPSLVARVLPGDLSRPLVQLLNRRQRSAGQPEFAPYIPTLSPPKTPFNRQVSSRRRYAFTELPLEESKAVGKAVGTTLNNVVVSMCAGALRRYLQDRGYPVDKPLMVCCPVSLRTGEEEQPWANHIFFMFAPLRTNLADPLERLIATAGDLGRAKASLDAAPLHLMRDASRFVPPAFMGLATNTLVRLPGDLSRTWFNVTISNVRGPAHLTRMNGLPVRGYHPAAFLTVGGNLNLSLWSYRGKLCLGIVGAREQVPELTSLTHYLADELRLLQEAVRNPSSSGATVHRLPVEHAG